jgi:PAP_fibrillin
MARKNKLQLPYGCPESATRAVRGICRSLPFNIPYPVPFKLLGDETKGWIDITYLNEDGTFRLTRGNKGALAAHMCAAARAAAAEAVIDGTSTETLLAMYGATQHAGTLFVLVKNESAVDSLLAAIRDKENDRVKALIQELSGTSTETAPARSKVIQGKWRLLWTEQADNANWLQKRLSGQVCTRLTTLPRECSTVSLA